MEGPCIRTFPRMIENNPIELRSDEKAKRLARFGGNLSAGGLFINTRNLPVGTHVRVKISGTSPVEVEGVVRHAKSDGVGIEFVGVDEARRASIDHHIEDLTLRGLPAA